VHTGYVEVVDPTLVGKTAEMMREGERDDNEQQQQQQQQLLDPGVGAFDQGKHRKQAASVVGRESLCVLPFTSIERPAQFRKSHL
jgi:hypothetical protein